MRRQARTTLRYGATRRSVILHARALKSKRQRPRRTGHRRLRVLVGPLLVVPVLALTVYGSVALVRWLHRGPGYIVEEIRVEGAELLGADEILGKAGLKPGRPIFDYSIHGARRALVADPLIRAATIVRRLPNTLVVRVVERQPIARLRSGGKDFLVDGDAVLFDLTPGAPLERLPRITGVRLKEPKQGDRVEDEKLSTALHVLKLYWASSMPSLMQIESVDVNNLSNVKLYPMPGPKTNRNAEFMLGDGDYEKRLARLSVALCKSSKPLGSLDLRLPSRVPGVTN
jgi:cell division septal protein FtsQ